MEWNYQTRIDPEIIIIDDAEETTTKGILKKPKTKKHQKREVKLGENETLYITQKLNVKKTKFNCIINIDDVPKKRKKRIHPSSIVRSSRNKFKKEAYYNRILPVCSRHSCYAGDISGMKCCRTGYRILRNKLQLAIMRNEMLSPISSIPLPDSGDVSFEDVSDESFSSVDELDTLIKRTKQRENKFSYPAKAYSAPRRNSSINEEATSTYSGGSLHSSSTLLTEAYSPTSPTTSPGDTSNESPSYFPTLTPDWIKSGATYIESPYSPSDPTKILFINELHEDRKTGNGIKLDPYSPASPPCMENNDEHKNRSHVKNNICKHVNTKINCGDHIKFEDIKREEESQNEDFINNGQSFNSVINKNNNILIKTEKNKCDDENTCDINENFEGFEQFKKPLLGIKDIF